MTNDDTALVRPELQLYVVTDGAGRGGHVASSVAISAIAEYFERTQESATLAYDIDGFGYFSDARRLASAIHHANDQIVAIARTSSEYRMMGSTVAACTFSTDTGHMHVASIGDSRCYRLRGGVLEQLTEDHSLLHDAIALRPDMCDDELAALPTHLVTRVLGTAEGLRVYARTFEVMPGDRLLLCSDGLTNSLDTATLRSVLVDVSDPERATDALVGRAFAEGAEDNVAVIVVDCSVPSGALLRSPRRAPRAIGGAHQATSPELADATVRVQGMGAGRICS